MQKPEIKHTLHIFALSAFAFAQPLYDLLGKNAAFFPVRGNETIDILTFTLSLSFLIPLVLILVINIGQLFSRRLGDFIYLFSITLLIAIISLPILKKIPAINTAFTTGFALIISISFTYLYYKKQAPQLFLTYLSPVTLFFPLLFLFNTQIYYLIFPDEPPQIETTNIKSKTPIVMIIFDELPVSTLMSNKHQIDHKLFPSFASFAKTSTWYPNTSTVAEFTIQAVPALLTGNLPVKESNTDRPKTSFSDWEDLPSYQYHPKNLFTALSPQYELRVFETVSSLCPKNLCEHTYDRLVNLDRRLGDLFTDLFLVYQHIIFPREITKKIPRIDMNWSDFMMNNLDYLQEKLKVDDLDTFQNFINSLTPSNKPTLYFHHTTIPHGPWQYLPSGKMYKPSHYSHALAANLTWEKDADLREPYQRHLLQTMFADKLLSDALNKIRQEGFFDEAIIIVTADHGASFKQGFSFREVDQNNYAGIMDVPFFIKHSNQKKASIDTTKIRTIDLIPTLFDALNDSYPWKTDGSTPSGKQIKKPEKLPVFLKNGEAKHIIHHQDEKLKLIEWKNNLIGNKGINGIYGGPKYSHLIGQKVNTECARKLTNIAFINHKNSFNSVNLSSNTIPSSIMGTTPKTPLANSEVFAIAVNDRIATILPSSSISNTSEYFHTMIDDHLIKDGNNTVDAYALQITEKCNIYSLPDIKK